MHNIGRDSVAYLQPVNLKALSKVLELKGYKRGHAVGYSTGYNDGYSKGYASGKKESKQGD